MIKCDSVECIHNNDEVCEAQDVEISDCFCITYSDEETDGIEPEGDGENVEEIPDEEVNS